MAKEFHLADILSISTGRLVSLRHKDENWGGMDGIYDILNYMTGDNLFTHQLPRAMEECRPHLLEQMPWLEGIELGENPDNWTGDSLRIWVDVVIAIHGEYHSVQPIPADDHDVVDPIQELRQMMPNKPVIVVSP